MSVQIRAVRPEDKEEWKTLFKGYLEFYKTPYSGEVAENNWKRFHDDNTPMWSALAIDPSTGRAIGMVNYLTHIHTFDTKDKLLLNDLFVDENSRLHGVGRALIEYVYDRADEMDIPVVYWHTDYFNHRAQMLYTKVGERTSKVQYKRP